MADLILDNTYLILLLPFWIFLIIMCGRFFSVYVNKRIIYFLTLLSSFLGSSLCGVALYKLAGNNVVETCSPFIKINDFILSFGLYVDRVSLIFALVLFLISFVVQMFSISFMKNEKKTYRYYALLNLFNFAMAGLLFSPNLFQTYVFWELVGIVSYLLIGFEYSKNEKSLASKKVLIINRIGDTAFITGIILSSYFVYEYSGNLSLTTLSFSDMSTISSIIYAYTSTPLFFIVCSLFIIGAAVKSAQFPFYTWLIDAMEAKLPVSALLHSATMVASGVFILIRLTDFLMSEAIVLKVIAILGLLTAVISSLSACAQCHPKKVLAYSTSAQLGLMFFAIGILNLKAAIAFFVAHAIIKSMLFLTLPRDGEKWNYINFVLFLLSGLSLSGIILAGLASKEMLFMNLGCIAGAMFSLISFLTAFYVIRIALVLVENQGIEKKFPKRLELLANAVLLILNVVLYLYLRKYEIYKIAEPFWWALFAWGVVYILYVRNAFYKIPVLYQICFNGFYLDKFYTTIVVRIYNSISQILSRIDENIFGCYKPFIVSICGLVRGVNFIETRIMDGMVRFITYISGKLSYFESKIQTGNIQSYNAYAFIIITVILTCLIMAYTAIMVNLGG